LRVISAYFDDSGTHDTSEIVVVAGVLASEGRLRGLEWAWNRELSRPIDGHKPPLKRFHMTECNSSTGEYAGWKRTETDYHCSLLRQAMIDSDVSAYGVATSRKDWDELVTGPVRDIMGTAEGFCIRNCFVRCTGWADRYSYDPEMRFVFDNRPSPVIRDAGTVYDAFRRFVMSRELTGITFENSTQTVLLQVADMIAWELYQHAKDIMAEKKNFPPRRSGFRHLAREIKFEGQIADKDSISEMSRQVWSKKDPGVLNQIADHFRNFDPKNPDYSRLS
jgi:hypothetical protein